jgi:hypothetical protein
MDRELDLRLPFLFRPGAYHKEVHSSLQCSTLYAQSLQPFYLLRFYMKSYMPEGTEFELCFRYLPIISIKYSTYWVYKIT